VGDDGEVAKRARHEPDQIRKKSRIVRESAA
jgi:hypothetical protein